MPDNDQQPPVETAQTSSSRTRRIALNNLYLDPNNYRFIDHADYVNVESEAITSDDVQRRTTGFLLGDSTDGIRDILASLKKNGWLPIDQIQVRELSKGKFLVVEGNRRVAALKYLQRRYQENGIDLGTLPQDFFSAVPVVIYDDDNPAQHLVVMGLAHIAGKKKWPPLNQAQALRTLITREGWTEDDVSQSLGMQRNTIRLMLGALMLCERYKDSDFGDQLTAAKYSLFIEVVKSPSIRSFIGWDRHANTISKPQNLERIFSWFSHIDDPDSDNGPEGSSSAEPAISTSANVRELAKIIADEAALRELDTTRRLSSATISSGRIVENRMSDAIQRIGDSVNLLFNNSARLSAEQLEKVEDLLRRFRGLLTSRDRQPMTIGLPLDRQPINTVRQGHFKELSLTAYRRFNNTKVEGLRRLNIFSGPNNAGKTSLLEAVQLLASQNDLTAVLEIAHRRGKMHSDPPPGWLKEQIPTQASIWGIFDSIPGNTTSVTISRDSAGTGVEDKTGYLASIYVNAQYGWIKQTAVTHLFEQRDRVTQFITSKVLCPVVFSSPYMQHDPDFLASLFAKGVEAGLKRKVVEFIARHMDPGFKDIDQTTARYLQKFTRFLVQHDNMTPAPDLGLFGEGLQRIFYIGLLFAYAKDGVVLIDEFESAIHFKLLLPFARLVHELAEEFNVQVFLTSHSKECIDAFAQNNYHVEDLAAYTLRTTESGTACYHYTGDQLLKLLDAIDLDLRS